MPVLKLQHVVSFNSEDKNNPADNLLKPEGFGKWVCAQTGTKQASVVIQFEKSSKIHQIDIGNAHAAFVEVLVGRSSQASEDDYQVILVASSFMSPIESRNSTNPNRVRIFDAEKLSKAVAEQKWDRAKIVCSQPFNKNITYGISFIKFHSPPEENKAGEEVKLGGFKLKASQQDDISPGTLFANRFKPSNPSPLTGAAAARAASRLADEAAVNKKDSARDENVGKRKHEENTNVSNYKKPESKPNSESKHISTTPPARKATSTSLSGKDSTPSKSTSSKPSTSTKPDRVEPPPKKKLKVVGESKQSNGSSEPKEFKQLMRGVVFVLSGFQNPRRGELRDKALQMGAQYKPDWGKGCTHLICAFANTPKYNQVKGKGKIVSREWIEGCHKHRRLLPWKKFQMGDAESSTDSEGDSSPSRGDRRPQSPRKPKSPTLNKTAQGPGPSSIQTPQQISPARAKSPSPVRTPQASSPAKDDPYGGSTDQDDGSDTEDDIRRVREQDSKKDTMDDPYGGSTDGDVSNLEIPELPDFLTGKHFLLYGEMSAEARKQMKRYIIAFNGMLEEYMSDKVTYVVTAADWDDQFDQALSDNANLIFVRPRWLEECAEQNKLVPHQRYLVVPK